LLPVRDIVIFPSMVLPLFVGREASIRAVESAMSAGRQLVFVAQRQATVEEPAPDDLYRVGTVVSVLPTVG
jgi:ATP-dependent Lon protease